MRRPYVSSLRTARRRRERASWERGPTSRCSRAPLHARGALRPPDGRRWALMCGPLRLRLPEGIRKTKQSEGGVSGLVVLIRAPVGGLSLGTIILRATTGSASC